MSKTTELLKELASMLDRGLITRAEFDREKVKILGPPTDPDTGASRPERSTVITGPPEGAAEDDSSTEATSPNVDARSEELPHSIGAYRILDVVGEGGMGRVFRARHRSEALAQRQGGDVALKVLHPQYARRPKIARRFEREAELGIKLDHPGVVRVHQLIMDRGQIALVMELVRGRQINEIFRPANGPVPWRTIQPLFLQLLEAVEHAHSNGVIHRDLKPDNVMITADDQIKVLDFGIAKDLDDGVTQTGLGMGTVDYMAPEQYTNAKDVGPSADIYALGVVLYQLLSGRLPWNSTDSKFTIMEQKKVGKFPPPTAYNDGIPDTVAQAIEDCIGPDPAQRPQSARALKELLEAAQGDSSEDEAVATGAAPVLTGASQPEAEPTQITQSFAAPPPPVSRPSAAPMVAFFLALFAVLGLGTLVGGGWLLWAHFSDSSTSSSSKNKDDDSSSGRTPTYADVCGHYVDNFAFSGAVSSEEKGDEYDECIEDVKEMRREIGEEQWDGFARCYVASETDADVDACLDEWNTPGEDGSVPNLPPELPEGFGDTGLVLEMEDWAVEGEMEEDSGMPGPERPAPSTGELYYDDAVMAGAAEWPYEQAAWGEWRFKSVEGRMEIYNRLRTDGVRLQFVGSSNGWFYMKTGTHEFTLYSALWTSGDSEFPTKGDVVDSVDSVIEATYRYGNYLLRFNGTDRLYICHQANDWCLEYNENSNGWITINSPRKSEPLTVFSSQDPSTIDAWGR